MKKILNKKLLIFSCLLIFLLIGFFIAFHYIFSKSTDARIASDTALWDGSIATSFSGGNGTSDNPYQIANGNELAYLSLLLNGINHDDYSLLYYKLTYDININNHDLTSFASSSIHFDGNGYTICNLNLTNGLFGNITNGSISNLNLENVNLTNSNSSTYGVLLDSASNSSLSNITIINANINASGNLGMLAGSLNNTSLTNIYLNGTSSSNIYGVSYTNTNVSSITKVITKVSYNDNYVSNFFSTTVSSSELYYFNDKYFYNGSKNISTDNLVDILNESSSGSLLWQNYNDNLVYEILYTDNVTDFASANISYDVFSSHESGVSDNILYVNDLESDYNYFMGLNYTETNNAILPDGTSSNKYNLQNMVKVEIAYIGSTKIKDTNYNAYYSIDKQIDTFIYYKYYEVKKDSNNNLYIMIELIDNPYTDLPDDYAFNGWYTTNTGASISLDSNTYTRYVKVPISTHQGSDYKYYPTDVVVNLYPSFVKANVREINSSSNLQTEISKLDSKGMKELNTKTDVYNANMKGYYTQVVLSYGSSMNGYYSSNGYYYSRGRNYCNQNSCVVYKYISSDTIYDSSTTYYTFNNYSMSAVDPSNLDLDYTYTIDKFYNNSTPMAGYFEKVTLYGGSLDGYYDASGNTLSGTAGYGVEYYKMIPYYNNSGEVNYYNSSKTYYYLVTRDTNILFLTGTLTGSWGSSQTKPLTMTSSYNGNNYASSVYWNIYNGSSPVYANADLKFENIRFYTRTSNNNDDPTNSTNTKSTFYGNYHNVKFGIGILRYNNSYIDFNTIIGGSNTSTGSSSNVTKYKLIIESGFYNSVGLLSGNIGSNGTLYVNAIGIYGNDYDRVNNDNSLLDVYFCLAGSWGGNIYSSSNKDEAIIQDVKSGSYGTGKYAYYSGIYVGGLNNGSLNVIRKIIYEGGYVYNLIGGPLSNSSTDYNDTYIYIKGGTIDTVFGAAGLSATYGNKVISFTDGVINYSLFGGSNSYSGTSGDGTLNGSTFTYIGGSATLGNQDFIDDESSLWGALAGNVFGAGNGNTSYSSLGTVNSSYIIIDDSATILGDVYGGGNFGSVSTSDGSSVIDLIGGTVNGNIYGASNQSGMGSSLNSASISINLNGGNTLGDIFGGSNQSGIVYGNVLINLVNGKNASNIYGGGRGNSTAINGNININVGTTETTDLNLVNIYGGSAYGIVNNDSSTTSKTDYNTFINTQAGIVSGSIYGGGMGSSDYTPIVAGDITVNVNGGNIANVYGGCNVAGVPNGSTTVNLNDGIVGYAFGGGNNTKVNDPVVNVNGGTITYVFGGSNNNGEINETTVNVSSSCKYVYGGNNLGGTVTNSKVYINAGEIDYLYGGGNQVTTTTTNVYIKGGVVNNAFGSGNESGSTTTNVNVTGGIVDYLYGGANQNGDVETTNVIVDKEATKPKVVIDVTYDKVAAEWRSTTYKYALNVTIKITNNYDGPLTEYDAYVQIRDSVLFSNYSSTALTIDGDTYSFDEKNSSYGTNQIASGSSYSFSFVVLSNYEDNDDIVQSSITGVSGSTVIYNSDHDVVNLFGGNNEGGTTTNTNVTVKQGIVYNIYGGGNYAETTNNNVKTIGGSTRIIYGGGEYATTNGNINLDVGVSDIEEFIYGGGDNADVDGTINVNVSGANVGKSIYGGSNTADVVGSILINVSNNTIVGRSIFGGGNHGKVGTVSTPSSTVLNIVGAKVGNNVYGGCNTSVVYGSANVNIGLSSSTVSNLTPSDILINGTVFGGGESNEAGATKFTYDFKSVIGTIDIKIDGTDYDNFSILGSIFGSGNASSSKGTSTIYIKNLGSRDETSKLLSIQRSDKVTIDKSVIEIEGITDSTNAFSKIPYSFNRINQLYIKDNSVVLVHSNTNMLKSFYSVTADNEKASVIINEDGTYARNVDNRLYTLENTNFYVTTDENATAYGLVSGMTFFGMFQENSDGTYNFGVYNYDVNNLSTADTSITGGSYVMGLHNLNHDIEVDGFYTNYNKDDGSVNVDYITPKPPTGTMYMWSIGTKTITYNVYLNSSSYSSSGTKVLPLVDFAEGDTIFNVISFNSDNLLSDLWLMDSNDVPKTTTNDWEAKTKIGLSMKSETTEWTSHNTTKFMNYYAGHYMSGDLTYTTDSQATVPSLMFYLYHAKNIAEDQDLGYIDINVQALTPTNEIEYDVTNVLIRVHLSVTDEDPGDSYDASITYGEKYEFPSSTTVNITNRSQFSTYFSLFIENKTFSEIYGLNNEYYHALVTDYVFPVGTKITMLDYGASSTSTPNYYYYIVDQDSYNAKVTEYETYGEVSYPISEFISMGSTTETNKYSESTNKNLYYKNGSTYEEFMFIFDFEDTTNNSTEKNNKILFELKNSDDRSVISVLSEREQLMFFSLYDTSNIALLETVDNDDVYITNNTNVPIDYSAVVNYDKNENFESVIDTNYEASNMGVNILFYDASNTQISSSLLEDTTITINNVVYHAYADGIYRIKLANKVSTLSKKTTLHIGNSLPIGHYKLKFVLFASDDGLFTDGTKETVEEIEIDVLDNGNAVIAENDNDNYIHEVNDEDSIVYNLTYYDQLNNPNLRLSIYKRNVDSSKTTSYSEINLDDIFDNELTSPTKTNSTYEKLLRYDSSGNSTLTLPIKNDIKSGTYKLVFKLCDNDHIVDDYETYIIIKKDVIN